MIDKSKVVSQITDKFETGINLKQISINSISVITLLAVFFVGNVIFPTQAASELGIPKTDEKLESPVEMVDPARFADNRGRIQIQGKIPRKLEKSWSWNQDEHITKSEALDELDDLWRSINSTEKKDRKDAIKKVKTFIKRCPENGCPKMRSKSFQDRNRKDPAARIDIEIIYGRAFVDDDYEEDK